MVGGGFIDTRVADKALKFGMTYTLHMLAPQFDVCFPELSTLHCIYFTLPGTPGVRYAARQSSLCSLSAAPGGTRHFDGNLFDCLLDRPQIYANCACIPIDIALVYTALLKQFFVSVRLGSPAD